MEDNYYIKTLLEKIESADPKSFSHLHMNIPFVFKRKRAIGSFL